MIKDTFFSASRFMNLCRKEMVENWKSHVLRVAMMYGVMAIAFVWNGYLEYKPFLSTLPKHSPENDPAWSFVLRAFVVFLIIFGMLSASFTMEKMKTKTSRLQVLMTPATPFEKYFSGWLLSTLVYIIVFLIAFKLADYTRVLVYMRYAAVYPDLKVIAPVDLGWLVAIPRFNSPFDTADAALGAISAYFFFQSCFVLGSAIWPKNSFIKTVAAGIIIIIVYVLVVAFFAKSLLPEHFNYNPDIEERTIKIIAATVAMCFAVGNWMLAYFRFKESEIINRM